jgi:hypothetical protein
MTRRKMTLLVNTLIAMIIDPNSSTLFLHFSRLFRISFQFHPSISQHPVSNAVTYVFTQPVMRCHRVFTACLRPITAASATRGHAERGAGARRACGTGSVPAVSCRTSPSSLKTTSARLSGGGAVSNCPPGRPTGRGQARRDVDWEWS